MKNKLVTVLVIIVLVLALGVAGALGFVWYRDNHVFVEGDAYPLDSRSLDLREQDVSFAYFHALQKALPDCEITWNVPFQGGKYPSNTDRIAVNALSSEDVELLKTYFPDLKTLDASECTDYAIVEYLQEQLPQLEVTYFVDLGGKTVEPGVTELVLEVGDYDLAHLEENLVYLHQLTAVQLRKPEMTPEEVENLRKAYEHITFTCTAEIFGVEYDTTTTELDLSAMTSDDVAVVAEKLSLLPGLTYVELMNAEGISQLTMEDVKTLMAAAPEVVFNYRFDFYGYTLSTADTEVHIKSKKIGDEGLDQVRAALDIMTNCDRFVLEYCQISYDLLAQLRDEYRDRTKVVWRVEFGGGSCYTDVEVIRCTYDLLDDNCYNLIYCEDVQFMDIGHNEWLDAVPFVAGMPNLRGIIVSGAPIKDLTPFENCKQLEFLEMGFCEYVTDLAPLANCVNLKMLNMSNTHALDLTPLDNLPLTHLCARTNPSGVSRISHEEQARFIAQHPDCWSTFSGAQPYGVGWRYDEDEITPLPYYAMLRVIFKYDESIIPNNVGWYLSDEVKALIEEVSPAPEMPAQTEETVPEETVPETLEATEPVTTEE